MVDYEVRAPPVTRTGGLDALQAVWLAAAATLVVTALGVLLLGPVVGRTLLATPPARFWPEFASMVRPEPVEQGRCLVALAAPALFALLTVAATRLRAFRAVPAPDLLAAAAECLIVAFAALCLLQQKELLGPLYTPDESQIPANFDLFSSTTLLVALAGTSAIAVSARRSRVRDWVTRWPQERPRRTAIVFLAAAAAVAVWLLPDVFTEDTIGYAYREIAYHIQFPLDETFAVLDRRSPLVNFAAQYGSLFPYVLAGGMRVFGETVGVWVLLAVCATGIGMLAIFAALRRVARDSLVGLILFLPVLATSFFMIGGTFDNRYSYGSYFGTFPLRYTGPSVLAWLVARHLGGARPLRAWPLFAAAGLVALNNADTGLPALIATTAAVLSISLPATRERLGRLALGAVGGLILAFAIVSVLTLVRAHALPDLGLLFRYSRLFASAGFGMWPMPTLGLHVAIYGTFAAAVGVATVRAIRRDPDRLTTGMLAWSGVFGLGACAYYVGRSTPEVLIALFFPWSFALALLLLPALRTIRDATWRRPPVAAMACVFAFLVAACSLAQTPTPWGQVDRLQTTVRPILADLPGQRFIDETARNGEPVAILMPLGHKIAASVGVVNVSAYSSSLSMPTVEQLDETIGRLRADGGRKLYVRPDETEAEMQRALLAAGFADAATDEQGSTSLWVDGTR